MLDEEAVETWGVGDALKGEFQAQFELPKMSRWFIWVIKLRICWEILRTPVRFREGDETTTKE